jgi:hypothetical protein
MMPKKCTCINMYSREMPEMPLNARTRRRTVAVLNQTWCLQMMDVGSSEAASAGAASKIGGAFRGRHRRSHACPLSMMPV